MTDRFFIDSLTLTGECYLIPAERRYDWDEFDCRCEATCEELPIPAWARPIKIVSHLEFEAPKNIFADNRSDDAAKSAVEGEAPFAVDWWNA